MPHTDPSRPTADVARRLAAVAGPRATTSGRVPPAPGPGWTDGDHPYPRVSDRSDPRPGASGRPDEPAPHPSAAPGRWTPSTTAALAEAARTASRYPGPARPRPRWAPGWRAAGAAVLALALAAGAIVLRSVAAPQGRPVAIPVPDVARAPEAARTPTGDEVLVHVVGAVGSPGVVRLPVGSRVADAVNAAGGSSPDANLAAVNLARTLTDGEQLVVPVAGQDAGPGAVPSGASPPDPRVDLNTADAAALEALPGVGPVLAERIVRRRDEQPFRTVEELDEVAGIGPALLAELREVVRV